MKLRSGLELYYEMLLHDCMLKLLKSSNDSERDHAELILLRQKLGDRDESLIQNELEDTKAKVQ